MKRRFSMFFFLIVLPVIPLLAGLYEVRYAAQAQREAAMRVAETEASLKAIAADKAKKQAAAGNDRHFVNSDAYDINIRRARDYLNEDLNAFRPGSLVATMLMVPPILAAIAIVVGSLALLWSVAGLAYLRWLGAQAMRSREQLLRAFSGGRKFLPVYVVSLLLFLSISIAAAMLFPAPYFVMDLVLHQGWFHGRDAAKPIVAMGAIGVSTALAGFGVMRSVIRAARRTPMPQALETLGSMVGREQAPALWAFVQRVAEPLGARMPDSIIVGLDQGFFVTEHPVHLRNGERMPQGRVLYMPLPYLAFLDEAQVAAIVGHEMGHFIGEDTIYSQKFSPIYSAAVGQLEAISERKEKNDPLSRVAAMFSGMFLDMFHMAVRHWSRQRELAADAIGAKVAGGKAAALALLRTASLSPHIDAAMAHYWDKGQVEGGILADVRRRVAAQGMADPRQRLQDRQAHPTDTHPQLAERLAALGVSSSPIDPGLLEQAMDPAASSLLRDWGLELSPADAAIASPQEPTPTASQAHVSVGAALQQELNQVSASARQKKIDELTRIAALPKAPLTPLKEYVGFHATPMAVVALLAFGLFVALAINIRASDWKNPAMFIVFGSLLLFVVPPCFFLRRIVLTRRNPVLLSWQGLQLPDVPKIVPWTAIGEVGVSTVPGHVFLHLKSPSGEDARAIFGQKSRHIKCNPASMGKSWGLQLSGLSKDRDREEAVTAFLNYWRAAMARAELERMGIPINSIQSTM